MTFSTAVTTHKLMVWNQTAECGNLDRQEQHIVEQKKALYLAQLMHRDGEMDY